MKYIWKKKIIMMRYTHLKKCHKSVECDITINHSCHGFIHRLGHCNTSHLHNGLNRPPQLKITMPEGGDTHSMKHTHTHTNLQIFFCYISIKKFRVGKSLFLHPPPPPPLWNVWWNFDCVNCKLNFRLYRMSGFSNPDASGQFPGLEAVFSRQKVKPRLRGGGASPPLSPERRGEKENPVGKTRPARRNSPRTGRADPIRVSGGFTTTDSSHSCDHSSIDV